MLRILLLAAMVFAPSATAATMLVSPTAGTYYARDALNPDVVLFHGRYLMFFSGNASDNPGDPAAWKMGAATATSPDGPFTPLPHPVAGLYNGGTIVDGDALVNVSSRTGDGAPAWSVSRDGVNWSTESRPMRGGLLNGDFFLSPTSTFYSYRTSLDTGASLWEQTTGGTRLVLSPSASGWDSGDLGEPSVFTFRHRRYMLYVGSRGIGAPRMIGLAAEGSDGWTRCGPFITPGGSWYSQNAIDPSALVVGSELYVYFGGGDNSSPTGGMNGTIGVAAYPASTVEQLCRV